jgi:hypothetical protein
MSTRYVLHGLALLSASFLMSSVPAGAGEVRGALAPDPTRLAGADDLGRMLLYTPNPLEGGSSMSHWDRTATPDLLMEPSASPSVRVGEVDLTLPHFRDIGWPEGSSTITIRVTDGVESGFNDPTEVSEAPGNPGGTTLGGQRLAAMQWAAAVWESYLRSDIEINIESSFRELECNSEDGTAVLASAGSNFLFADFTNAPHAETWYHGALAEALADENLSNTEDGRPPDEGDIRVNFNSGIDQGCLSGTFRYYYGLDGNTPAGQIPFAMIALHEMAHGLGFSNFVNLQFGTLPNFPGTSTTMPDIYTKFTYDKDLELHWDVMTSAERRESAINTNRVVWDGPNATNASAGVLDNEPRLAVAWPRIFDDNLEVQTAQFGPPVPEAGISGELVQVRDGTDQSNLGCEALTNASEVAGAIAVVDRGDCFFSVKTKNAQDAGALAVVVVNNVPDGLPPMGGDDPTVTIPAVGISQADGEAIKRALESETSRHRVPADRISVGQARPR